MTDVMVALRIGEEGEPQTWEPTDPPIPVEIPAPVPDEAPAPAPADALDLVA